MGNMTFASLFSGIGGFDLGLERAGMRCVMQVEIDKHCNNVLARHWPDVERRRDVRDVERITADVICGGFPCQDVSVAGKRAGLAGERSGLWYEFRRIIDASHPRFVVIENVPGLLSSAGGRDFAAILRGLANSGYRYSWRVLDSRYFGVAQRRRRVFIVGSLAEVGRSVGGGDIQDGGGISGVAAQVLFERDGDSGNRAAGGEARKGTAGVVAASLNAHGYRIDMESEAFVPEAWNPSASTLSTHIGTGGGNVPMVFQSRFFTRDNKTGNVDSISEECPPLRASSQGGDSEPLVFETRYLRNGRGAPDVVAPPLKAQSGGTGKGDAAPVVAHTLRAEADASEDGTGRSTPMVPELCWDAAQMTSKLHRSKPSAISQPLNTLGQMMVGIRRLTPVECERLQGFPDGWTEPESDSARYRMLGNAVTVPVAEWIGRRIVTYA